MNKFKKIDIENELREYIQALTGTTLEINSDSTMESMSIDSISLVKLFVFIEKHFGISLINAGLSREEIETFGTITNYILSKVSN